jgi:hypothetical protein
MKAHVYNLSDDSYEVYTLPPMEALISAAILKDKRTSQLTDKAVRDLYMERIEESRLCFVIGDLCVRKV